MANSSSAKFKGLQAPRTITEQVTEQLRDSIVLGKLRPGEHLSQDKLADQFGVSRLPVRESLLQLAAEGLVTLKSHRGAVVAELSAEQIKELFAIAVSLERLATCRGVGLMKEADFADMERLLKSMKQAENDPFDWYRLNQEFHASMYGACGWRRLISMIVECRRNLARYITNSELHAKEVHTWHDQHITIFEAARRRDLDLLDQLIVEHFEHAERTAMPYLSENTNTEANPGETS